MRCHRREKIGRLIGAIGGACASALWGFLVFAAVAILIEPGTGLEKLVVIVAMPVGVLASMLLVASVADVIILARRVDTSMPWRIASTHVVLALVMLWGGAVLGAIAMFAISATQIVAIRLFQMTPSHASSQR